MLAELIDVRTAQLVSWCAAIAVAGSSPARADPARSDLSLERSQIGWQQTLAPDHVSLASESGWDGAARRAVVDAAVEATVWRHASVFATMSYVEIDRQARPGLGRAFQLVDPATTRNGARISVAYKPEGFSEPGGELESILVLSRRLDGRVVRAMLAYGRDVEGSESDGELGGSYLQRERSWLYLGATARIRYGIATRPGDPRWDAIAGGLAGIEVSSSRLELLVGSDTLAEPSPRSGLVALIGVGCTL